MKVYIQWAKAQAEDWQPLEVRSNQVIASLFKRGVPNANSRVDNQAGWICGLNCQGIDFSGYDHVAIEVIPDGLRITGWEDDSDDFGDTRWATEWTLRECKPDPRIGGRMNTDQSRRVFATPDAAEWFGGYGPDVLPWEDFALPPANLTFHGVWLSDDDYAAHQAARTPHGWREWVT